MCTCFGSNWASPTWRKKTYRDPIPESVYIFRMVSELEQNIYRAEYQEFITEHFDPASIIRKYRYNPNELCIDRVVALNIAELIRRIKCLRNVLKKIDESDKDLYVSDTVSRTMYEFDSTIKSHADSDTYEYDMLCILTELHDKLKRMIFNIISDVSV